MPVAKDVCVQTGSPVLPKSPTGIQGLDEITLGGFPRSRPTLLCGGAGCGKTVMAMEFLVRGACQFGEPGVFVSFEENPGDLAQNVASLGFDVPGLIASDQLRIDNVRIERSEIEETGEYDLEGLFIRLGHLIDTIHAKRVVLDTVEALFGGFSDQGILRAELRRLFQWLKDKEVTAVITAERGDGMLTRAGLEEYVSDCVLLLDQQVAEGVTTRRMRIIKYRGSSHGSNEYPFLIGETGISVLPLTSVELNYDSSAARVSSGIAGLDEMLGGPGFWEGSAILVSGSSGTGKTSMGASFLEAASRRGDRALLLAFEESASQIVRNMQSIGLDLGRWIDQGRLRIETWRPTAYSLEMHLVRIQKAVRDFSPQAIVLDPISSLLNAGSLQQAASATLRIVDFLKHRQITTMVTSLQSSGEEEDRTELSISSIVDTWVLLRNAENGGERNRLLYVLKSRGMAHSNQVREFLMSDAGILLREAYLGPGGVLTGSARTAQENREKIEEVTRRTELERRRAGFTRKRRALEAQIAQLQAEIAMVEDNLGSVNAAETDRENMVSESRQEMAHMRFASGTRRGRGNSRGEKQ